MTTVIATNEYMLEHESSNLVLLKSNCTRAGTLPETIAATKVTALTLFARTTSMILQKPLLFPIKDLHRLFHIFRVPVQIIRPGTASCGLSFCHR